MGSASTGDLDFNPFQRTFPVWSGHSSKAFDERFRSSHTTGDQPAKKHAKFLADLAMSSLIFAEGSQFH